MSRLTIHTVESAPEAAQVRVATALKNNGFLPNLIGVLANAPTALEMYQEVGAINAKTSLTPAERERVNHRRRHQWLRLLRGRSLRAEHEEKPDVARVDRSIAPHQRIERCEIEPTGAIHPRRDAQQGQCQRRRVQRFHRRRLQPAASGRSHPWRGLGNPV